MHEVLGWPGPMTHRQFLVWSAWLDEQWNRPDRTDHYLMQVAAEVRRGNAGKKARQVKMQHFLLEFKQVQKEKRKETAAEAKARWLNVVGYKEPIKDGGGN